MQNRALSRNHHSLHLESEHLDGAFHKARLRETELTHITGMNQPMLLSLPDAPEPFACLLSPGGGRVASASWSCHQMPSRSEEVLVGEKEFVL